MIDEPIFLNSQYSFSRRKSSWLRNGKSVIWELGNWDEFPFSETIYLGITEVLGGSLCLLPLGDRKSVV